tara:strand:- start:32383 stop:32820 length:438 start_codon:yes stop_codon:yes gene_type:complete
MVAHHVMELKDISFVAHFLRVGGLENHFLYFDTGDVKLVPEDSDDMATRSARMIDFWFQVREKIIGIGSMEWLTKFAASVEVSDLETAAYMFFSYVSGIMRSVDASDPRDKIFAGVQFPPANSQAAQCSASTSTIVSQVRRGNLQ